MPTNMFGEEFIRVPLTLEAGKTQPVAWIMRGKIVLGFVKQNGCNDLCYCEYDIGEPIVSLFRNNSLISFKEMTWIMEEYKKLFPEKRVDKPATVV